MPSATIPDDLRQKIIAEYHGRCAYCQTAELYSGAPLEIDHIVPRAVGGVSEEDNLCPACRLCNGYKGTQTEAVDPETGQMVPLFNPRLQVWNEHFAWSADGATLLGLTPVGRATVLALQMNNRFIVPARRRWVVLGWPPDITNL